MRFDDMTDTYLTSRIIKEQIFVTPVVKVNEDGLLHSSFVSLCSSLRCWELLYSEGRAGTGRRAADEGKYI